MFDSGLVFCLNLIIRSVKHDEKTTEFKLFMKQALQKQLKYFLHSLVKVSS